MAKITLKSLTDTREKYDSIVEALKSRFSDNLLYQETLSTGEKRRPVFLVKNQTELDDIKKTLQQLVKLSADIRALAGYDVRMPLPALEEGVLLYRIWVNMTNASSASNTTRDEIILRLQKRIDTCTRNMTLSNELLLDQLKAELEFFQAETETVYRARSKGHPVTFLGISKIHGIDGRIKPNEAGTFIVGPDFETPRGEIPDENKTKKRKQRPGVFDGIEPVPYSGAANALLYRESEVKARKEAIGFTTAKQKSVVDKNKSKKTRRKIAA